MTVEQKNQEPVSNFEAGSAMPESNPEKETSGTEVAEQATANETGTVASVPAVEHAEAANESSPDSKQGEAPVAPAEEQEKPNILDFLPADFGSQIERSQQQLPKVVVTAEYCTAAKGSDCQRCAYCCPHDAIEWREGKTPRINSKLCKGCGICFGVCDAFTPTDPDLRNLHKRIARIAVTGRRAHLACERCVPEHFTPDDNVVVLPCLSMISPALFTQLLAEGIGLTICCDLADCQDCPMGAGLGGELFPRAIEIAQERTGEDVKHSKKLPEAPTKKVLEAVLDDENPLGRRQAFEDLASEVLDVVSGRRSIKQSTTLQDYAVKRYRQDAISRIKLPNRGMFDTLGLLGRKRTLLFPAQRMLLETILIKPAVAERIPIALSETDKTLCCKSFDCVGACPTGARAISTSDKLEFEPMLCIGCGICVDTCPHGACSVDVTTADSLLASIAPEKLRAVEEQRMRSKSKK